MIKKFIDKLLGKSTPGTSRGKPHFGKRRRSLSRIEDRHDHFVEFHDWRVSVPERVATSAFLIAHR